MKSKKSTTTLKAIKASKPATKITTKKGGGGGSKSTTTKRADRGVPFDEMRRLMKVYGSIKCLRKRQSKSPITGEEQNAKIDSVKRKFYRWFPDLEARFVKDEESGFYRPKFGHEFEMKYREEMRTKDGEILAKKRARCRKMRYGGKGGGGVKAEEQNENNNAHDCANAANATVAAPTPISCSPVHIPVMPGCARVSPSPVISAMTMPSTTSMPAILYFPKIMLKNDQEDIKEDSSTMKVTKISGGGTTTNTNSPIELQQLQLEHDSMLPMTSDAIAADTEPLDRSFIAETGIFDDVENSFFGPTVEDCPSVTWSSCSGSSSTSTSAITDDNNVGPIIVSRSSSCSSNSSNNTEETEAESAESQSLQEMLDKSIEECCEEILGSECNDDSVGGYIFDMISS